MTTRPFLSSCFGCSRVACVAPIIPWQTLFLPTFPGVAKALLQLANRFGVQDNGNWRVHHDLTQEEIAQLVGASRETVNKALAEFAHRGWIRLEGKTVVICNSERLARRAR